MSKLPKLKVQSLFGSGNEPDICDLEQAKNRFDYGSETIVLVEGQVVNSHEELIELASQDQYKDKEFLEVVLSPQVVVVVLVVVFIRIFEADIKALMARTAKIRLPGGSELSTTQLEKAAESAKTATDTSAIPSPDTAKLPDELKLTSGQIEKIEQFIKAERANAALWEYRFLNYYLVLSTQRVLDWFRTLENGTSVSFFDNFWRPLLPNPDERAAIIGALKTHFLVIATGELLEITEKGREYIRWRGPLPEPKT